MIFKKFIYSKKKLYDYKPPKVVKWPSWSSEWEQVRKGSSAYLNKWKHLCGQFLLLLQHVFVIVFLLHDPILLGWNFNPSSQARFHLTITWGNRFSSQQGRRVYKDIIFFVYISLQKLTDSHWFKNVLLELLGLQLFLIFFHKRMKFYKDICLLFFSKIDVISVLKIQIK